MITSNENIRNSKSRLLRLSSEDKILGTNGRFTIELAASGGIIDNIKGYIVHSIQCPNVFDNIPTYANGIQLVSTTGATTYDIVVPNSYYYIDDLITALSVAVNAAIPDTVAIVKVGVSPVQKIQMTFTGDEYTVVFANSTIAYRLGITEDLVFPDGVAVIAPEIYNLTGETDLYVHSRVLAPNNLVEGSGSFSVVDKLNLDKQYGAMCYSAYESLKTFRTIRLTIRNRIGEVLTLPPNYNISVMVMLFYK